MEIESVGASKMTKKKKDFEALPLSIDPFEAMVLTTLRDSCKRVDSNLSSLQGITLLQLRNSLCGLCRKYLRTQRRPLLVREDHILKEAIMMSRKSLLSLGRCFVSYYDASEGITCHYHWRGMFRTYVCHSNDNVTGQINYDYGDNI